ncbi:MAG: ATP-binding cassette domain-containing protein [bacterium]|nr:ATP-binding cassette domain-containing protein [bacterium]
MISLKKVSKFFGRFKALDEITFRLKKGETTAFLGVNGAGKTTTMRIINGILDPDLGEVKIDKYSPADNPIKVKQIIGYLPENNPLYTHLRVSEYLHFIAQVRNLPGFPHRYKHLFTHMGIAAVWDQKIEEISRGYKQRVGLTAALIHQPKVLVLDEPLSGLDPLQKEEITSLLKTLGQKTTILFSTHVLSEVESLCSNIIIIHQGRIIFAGSLSDFTMHQTQIEVVYQGPKKLTNLILKDLPRLSLHQIKPVSAKTWHAVFNLAAGRPDRYLKSISAAVAENKGLVTQLNIRKQSLESLFTKLTDKANDQKAKD